MASDRTMKIALAGIGKIAYDQHIPSIAASPDWELCATVSRHHTVGGIEAYQDLATMLEARPDIEVVSLCMPPVPRFDNAAAALAAGRHVMLEKPPGATLSECHQLQQMARAAGLTIYATWHSREAAQVAAAKTWLRKRKLRRLSVVWKEDVRRWHPGQAWIWQPGGLGVFDPGINALSILTAILPERFHLKEATIEFPENRDAPIAASLEFATSGAFESLTAEFDWRQTGPQTWEIAIETGDGTELTLSDGGAKLEVNGVLDVERPPHEYEDIYIRFAELLRDKRSLVDEAPLRLVADSFLIGRRVTTDPFYD